MEVNQKELANILGITTRRVRQLRDEEKIFKYSDESGSKKYDLKKRVQNYIQFKSSGGSQHRDIEEKSS